MNDAQWSSKRDTRTEPQLAHSFVHLLVVVFVASVVGLLWLIAIHMTGSAHFSHQAAANETGQRCVSSACEETARIIKRFRSVNTSPCVDFYKHVCGSTGAAGSELASLRQVAIAVVATIVAHHLAQRAPRWHQTASQKASAFLHMCKTRVLRHEDNLPALRSYVESNMLFAEDADYNPLVKIAEQVFVAGLPIFYQMDVDGSLVWRHRYLISLEISAAIKLWFKAQRAFADREGYRKLVQGMLQNAGMDSGKAEALSSAIFDLDDVVYSAYNQYLIDNKSGVREFIVSLDEFAYLVSNDSESKEEWKYFVRNNVAEGFPFPPHVYVTEAAVAFLKNVIEKLDDVELRTLINWQLIREAVAASGVAPLVSQHTQWYCIEMTLHIYGNALTVPYLRSYVKRKTLRKMVSVYHNIKSHLMRAANLSLWLRGSSLAVMLAEFQRLKTRLIFPPTLESTDVLNELYGSYPDVRSPFLSAYWTGLRANAKSVISQTTAMFTDVSASDARKVFAMMAYNRKANTLFISGSAASAPALDAEGTEEVNHAFFGRIVAQGLLHVLAKFADDTSNSSKINKAWSTSTKRGFSEVVHCLEKQAVAFRQSSTWHHRRHNQVRDAARGGGLVSLPVVLEALGLMPLYEAYATASRQRAPLSSPSRLPGLKDVFGDRLFFFAWCYSLCSRDNSPPDRSLAVLRCNLPLANQAAFIEAFSCGRGQPMNPDVKCPLW